MNRQAKLPEIFKFIPPVEGAARVLVSMDEEAHGGTVSWGAYTVLQESGGRLTELKGFYVNTNVDPSKESNDPAVQKFWESHPEAYRRLFNPRPVRLKEALQMLDAYLQELKAAYQGLPMYLLTRPHKYDGVKLEEQFAFFKLDLPFGAAVDMKPCLASTLLDDNIGELWNLYQNQYPLPHEGDKDSALQLLFFLTILYQGLGEPLEGLDALWRKVLNVHVPLLG
ncbi:MAG: hypothetical protein COY40_01330 [Alphaproteobacteria bacterium CG_4_10_14_0_8_um_filter_53_9]|nr:MAG: hypothetical protein COY40_01330 [Alphaproteobacteria bacterium CG_4_10_14_0_8_um_filter_53_9]